MKDFHDKLVIKLYPRTIVTFLPVVQLRIVSVSQTSPGTHRNSADSSECRTMA